MISGRSCLNGGDAIGYPTLTDNVAKKEAQYGPDIITTMPASTKEIDDGAEVGFGATQ